MGHYWHLFAFVGEPSPFRHEKLDSFRPTVRYFNLKLAPILANREHRSTLFLNAAKGGFDQTFLPARKEGPVAETKAWNKWKFESTLIIVSAQCNLAKSKIYTQAIQADVTFHAHVFWWHDFFIILNYTEEKHPPMLSKKSSMHAIPFQQNIWAIEIMM